MTSLAGRQAALIDEAIAAAREDDFLRALTIFIDVYGIDEKTARMSSEQKAMQLLQDAFGAEKISES